MGTCCDPGQWDLMRRQTAPPEKVFSMIKKKKECMRKYHLLYGGLAVPDWHPELAQPSHNHDDYSEVAGMEAGRMERQKAPEPRQSC